jgi:predicted RecA/RadA family phage recombinase
MSFYERVACPAHLSKSLPVHTSTRSGDLVIIGGLCGVAETDGDGGTTSGISTGQPDGNATIALGGDWLTKVNIAGTGTEGAPVYAGTVSNGIVTALTLTASTNKRVGYLTKPHATTATPGEIQVIGTAIAD